MTSTRVKNKICLSEGDTAICQTSDGRIFFQEIRKNDTIRIRKKAVSLKPVIGAHYGSVFEEKDKKLVLVTGGLFPDPVAPETGEAFVPENDNRSYTDTNSAQKLSVDELVELRDKGASGKEIIQKLVENSKTWDSKTEFSKQKYLKKKQQKYMPRVRFLKCTPANLCMTYRSKSPAKICNLREDTLGQMLMYGNIFAGGQVIVVDTVMGLVTSAIADRMAGIGRILAAYDGQQPSVDIIRRLNFEREVLESIHYFPFSDVGLLPLKEQEVKGTPQTEPMGEEEKKRREAERLATYTEEERRIYDEKKKLKAERKITKQPASVVREWLREGSDSLVLACTFDPEKVLLKFLPYLKNSKPFVIYSEYLEPLTRTFQTLQQMETILDLQLNETWTREYQVLPGRTHPEMKMNACSGYLLSGIKVPAPTPQTTDILPKPISTNSSDTSIEQSLSNKRQKIKNN